MGSIEGNFIQNNNNRSRLLLEASAKASQALISNKDFDTAVNDVLGIIFEAAGQDRAYIFEFHKDIFTGGFFASQRFEKVKDGITKQIDNIELQNMPVESSMKRWFPALKIGKFIKGNIKDFPDDEREMLENKDILSLLAIPIFVDRECWGFLGFDNCSGLYDWNDSELTILKNISSALGLYIYRNHQRLELIIAKEQAQESEIYANSLFEQSPFSIQFVGVNGIIEKVNKAFDTLFMIPREKVLGKFNVLKNPRSIALGWDRILMQIIEGESEYVSKMNFNPLFFGYSGEAKLFNCIVFPIRFKGKVKKVAIMHQDITNLSKLEDELKSQNKELIEISKEIKEKEIKYKSILENSFNLISQFSFEGIFLYYNRVHYDVLGYDQYELLGTSGFDLSHPDDLEKIRGIMNELLVRSNEVNFVSRIRTKSGDYKLIDNRFKLLKGNDENEDTVLYSGQDITEKTRNELLLQIQRNLTYSIISCKNFAEFYTIINQEINTIIPSNNLYVVFYEQKTGLLSMAGGNDKNVNTDVWPAKGSLTGYTIMQNKSVFAYKEDIINLHQAGEVVLMGKIAEVWLGVPFKSDCGIQGAIVIENFDNQTAINKADIEVVELIANEIRIFLDKKNAEENTLKLTKAVTESPASVVITNIKGDIEYVNPKFTSLTGYTYSEVIGLNPRILKSGYTPDSEYKNLWETISSGKEWRGEFRNKKKCGEFYWEDTSISPILDENGKISHYVSVKEDVTDRKRLISQLIESRDKAEESDRLKTSFLQNISHEIRTPMNGILGFIELLRDPNITGKEQSLYFEVIEKSSQRMLSTINNIIDISKIEAGVSVVKRSTIYINQVVSDVVEFFRPEVEKKGMKINLNIDQSVVQLQINSDLEKIYATLTNIIKNAIKYSIKGEINVGANLIGPYVEFYVEDTGIGIPEDKLEKIFERFVQAEAEVGRTLEGAGLGLSIVKAYIELLGGDIYVESQQGVGSKFVFTIPLDSPEVIPNNIKNSPQINNTNQNSGIMSKPIKILIAEDEETNSIYLKTILRQTNYELIFAKNGKEALDLFTCNRDVDLILMDIRMPLMDGYQATKHIKELDSKVIIIAQTAYAFAGDKKKALEVGCDDYLSKPIRKEDLIEMINKHLSI